MKNVLIFVFVASMSFHWKGSESQKTIEDDVCEDWKLKLAEKTIEMLEKSLETATTSLRRMEVLQKICEKSLEVNTQSSPEGTGFTKQPVIINLVKRLNQSFSSTTVRCYVIGITKHEDRIYVLCENPCSIRVFEDRNQFRLLSEVQLRQIGMPHDIVYNHRLKCFYVSDWHNRCVWNITIINGNQAQATKWLSGTIWPHKLSLSSEGHLLVFSDAPISVLNIYNASDARLIRNLRLHSSIEEPRHAIQTRKREEFLIMHRLRDGRNGSGWVISRVSNNGLTIIAQSNSSSDSEDFDYPDYLSLDPDDNLLFVADNGNQRVVLFDAESLHFRQAIVTRKRNGIQFPQRLYYDKEMKQLIVGQWQNWDYDNGGVVDVYKIK